MPQEKHTELSMDVISLLGRLDERTELMQNDIGTLKHVLIEGNGVPPVTAQLATLNAEVAGLKDQAKDYRIPRAVWLGIVISAVIGLLGIVVAIKNW